MKCLSVNQPFATLIAIGVKGYETRSWMTHYTGPLAIHASKNFPDYYKELCHEEPFCTELARAGYTCAEELPTGVVVCVCEMYGCYQTTGYIDLDWNAWLKSDTCARKVEYPDSHFGDYSNGRFAFGLGGVERLRVPVPLLGKQGLFNIPADIEEKVKAQL